MDKNALQKSDCAYCDCTDITNSTVNAKHYLGENNTL